MGAIYARIEIPESSVKHLQELGLDVDDYSEDADEYPHNGETWFSIPMEGGSVFIDDIERLGFPVPLTGFRETDMMHTAYIFVCPGDGTYHEVQCNEDQQPVVSAQWNGEYVTPEVPPAVVEYFQAYDRFNEATK